MLRLERPTLFCADFGAPNLNVFFSGGVLNLFPWLPVFGNDRTGQRGTLGPDNPAEIQSEVSVRPRKSLEVRTTCTEVHDRLRSEKLQADPPRPDWSLRPQKQIFGPKVFFSYHMTRSAIVWGITVCGVRPDCRAAGTGQVRLKPHRKSHWAGKSTRPKISSDQRGWRFRTRQVATPWQNLITDDQKHYLLSNF